MGKTNRRLNLVYSEEREDRTKDANSKLKSQIKKLTKAIKQLESENRTLTRAFNKSCDYIQKKIDNKSLEEILDIIEDYNCKETSSGLVEVKKQKKDKECVVCPKCSRELNNGYKVIDFPTFVVENCECGHRSRIEKSEGIKRD